MIAGSFGFPATPGVGQLRSGRAQTVNYLRCVNAVFYFFAFNDSVFHVKCLGVTCKYTGSFLNLEVCSLVVFIMGGVVGVRKGWNCAK